jgi:uncharacterized membrane protein
MKTLFSKFEWILWLIVLAPIVLLFGIWEQIPPIIPTHYNLAGEADAWGDKTMLLWLVPTVNVLTYLLLLFVPLIDPKKRIESMGNKYFTLFLP